MIVASKAFIAEARGWMADCAWREDPEELEALTDQQVLLGVHAHYEGGLLQLARHADLAEPFGVPEWHSNLKR